ncbi:hypothetical protein FNV43_RR11662 [Rhamnella rubrinervis]|uniref:Uncharacterized protein n=1 Tax=Rhamnella rubrinervis TaxID=2594499 RepID=A0A8K0MI26_9ROSA|nr:hypothetical protein FNV43_RR11662 [Rhamnella rubrinervis]
MTTTSLDTHIDVDFTGSQLSFPDCPGDEPHQTIVPLLRQPTYGGSKSLISEELRNFRISLKWCALDHSSCYGKFISYLTFIILAIIVPVVTTIAVEIPASSLDGDPISFNKLVQLPESGLAAIGFFTVSRLFVDGLGDDSLNVRRGYTRELDKAFRYLACILLPSFFIELAHKIIFFSTVKISLPCISPGAPLNSIVFVLVLASWIYRTGVFLLVCVLFRLTCELQIHRFEGFHKLFEGCESDSTVIFEEHVRIRKQLLLTSHRYRFFIIACLVTITVSQFVALLLVLVSKSEKTFFNSGDLLICSVVELCGFCLCLLGAARITHRAQGIVGIATRWHMVVTSASVGLEQCKANASAEPNAPSDCCDSSDNFITVSPQDPSSFQTRQALVTYLQHNNGGITLFGFALDRGLLHTLFAFEFSLVLWILSKVVVLS